MNHEPILGFQGDYRFLSNFWMAPFTVDLEFLTAHEYHSSGELPIKGVFSCTEKYFMFHKSKDPAYRQAIRQCDTPGQCKKLGKQADLVPYWEEIKEAVMLDALRYKFVQNPDLAVKLWSTQHRYLEETNTWGDRYWGVCDGTGLNRLGLLLMQVRAELSTPGNHLNRYKA